MVSVEREGEQKRSLSYRKINALVAAYARTYAQPKH